jgi:hypothetical protein
VAIKEGNYLLRGVRPLDLLVFGFVP